MDNYPLRLVLIAAYMVIAATNIFDGNIVLGVILLVLVVIDIIGFVRTYSKNKKRKK